MMKRLYLILGILSFVFSLHGMEKTLPSDAELQKLFRSYKIESDISKIELKIQSKIRQLKDGCLLVRCKLYEVEQQISHQNFSQLDLNIQDAVKDQRDFLLNRLSSLKKKIEQMHFELEMRLERMLPPELKLDYNAHKELKKTEGRLSTKGRTNVWIFLKNRERMGIAPINKIYIIAGRYPEIHARLSKYLLIQDFILKCKMCNLSDRLVATLPSISSSANALVTKNFDSVVDVSPYKRTAALISALTKSRVMPKFGSDPLILENLQAVPCSKSRLSSGDFDATEDLLPLRHFFELNQESKKLQALLRQSHTQKRFMLNQAKVARTAAKNESLVKTKKSPKILLFSKKQDLSVQNPILKYCSDLQRSIRSAKSFKDFERYISELEVLVKANLWEAKEFLGVFYSEYNMSGDGSILRNPERAIQLLESCFQEKPDLIKPKSLYILGKLLSEKTENLERALKFINLALSRKCKVDREDITFLSELYLEAGQMDESIKWLKKSGNDEIVLWYKGYDALAKGDLNKAIDLLEQTFPLIPGFEHLKKQYLVKFDFVVQELLKQIENPKVNALLVRMDIAVGLKCPKITRKALVEKLISASHKERSFSADFMLAYIYANNIEVESATSKQAFFNVLKEIHLLASEGSTTDGVEELKKLINEKPDFRDLLILFTDVCIKDLVYIYLHEDRAVEVNSSEMNLFLIFICNVLTCFFADNKKALDWASNAALFFMSAENYVNCICKKEPNHSVKNSKGLAMAFKAIHDLATKKQNIYGWAALSFSTKLHLIRDLGLSKEIKSLGDSEKIMETFFSKIITRDGLDAKDDYVLAVACGCTGAYFIAKREIPKAKKCLEIGLKFYPEGFFCAYELGILQIDFADNIKELEKGKDLILKIYYENPRCAELAYRLGFCFDEVYACGVKRFIPKFKNNEDALYYYDRAAELGHSAAAASWLRLVVREGIQENIDKILKYFKIAGTELLAEERVQISKIIDSKSKVSQDATPKKLVDEFQIVKENRHSDPISLCKYLLTFFSQYTNIHNTVDKKLEICFQLLKDLSNTEDKDSRILSLIALFVKRIDDIVLSKPFFEHIQTIECSLQERKMFILDILTACYRQSNFERMAEVLVYYLERFVHKKSEYDKEQDLIFFLGYFREHVGADEKLRPFAESIDARVKLYKK